MHHREDEMSSSIKGSCVPVHGCIALLIVKPLTNVFKGLMFKQITVRNKKGVLLSLGNLLFFLTY